LIIIEVISSAYVSNTVGQCLVGAICDYFFLFNLQRINYEDIKQMVNDWLKIEAGDFICFLCIAYFQLEGGTGDNCLYFSALIFEKIDKEINAQNLRNKFKYYVMIYCTS